MEDISRKLNSNLIFGLGTVYFLVVLAFGLVNLEANFIMDGYSIIFHIADNETFTPASGRYVMWIPQLLPVLFSKTGAGISTIMKGYVINDILLFYVGFVFLWFGLKRPFFALLLVGTYAFGMYFNHFMMVGELQPGSAFTVLSLAVLANWKTSGLGQKLLLGPFLILIVWSHPLALVSFISSVGLIFLLDKKNESTAERKVLVAVVIGVMLLKAWFLAGYDVRTIGHPLRTWSETLRVFFKGDYLIDQILYLAISSPVGLGMLLINLYVFGKTRSWVQLFTLVLFCVSWWFVVNMYVDLSDFNLNLATNMMANRYLFPVQFLNISVLCLVVLPWVKQQFSMVKPELIFCGFWFLGLGFFQIASIRANRTINEFKQTITEARRQGLSKSFYPIRDYCRDIYLHNGSFYATYILSSIDGGEPCQVVHATQEEIERLVELDDDMIYLMHQVQVHSKSVNSKRFTPLMGSYTRLDYRCDRATIGGR